MEMSLQLTVRHCCRALKMAGMNFDRRYVGGEGKKLEGNQKEDRLS